MEYENMTMTELKNVIKDVKKANEDAKKVFKNVSKMKKGEIVDLLKIQLALLKTK